MTRHSVVSRWATGIRNLLAMDVPRTMVSDSSLSGYSERTMGESGREGGVWPAVVLAEVAALAVYFWGLLGVVLNRGSSTAEETIARVIGTIGLIIPLFVALLYRNKLLRRRTALILIIAVAILVTTIGYLQWARLNRTSLPPPVMLFDSPLSSGAEQGRNVAVTQVGNLPVPRFTLVGRLAKTITIDRCEAISGLTCTIRLVVGQEIPTRMYSAEFGADGKPLGAEKRVIYPNLRPGEQGRATIWFQAGADRIVLRGIWNGPWEDPY